MKRHLVSELPENILVELRQRLLDSGFSGYEQLSEWIANEGYSISKSSLHRYAQSHEGSIMAMAKCGAECAQDLRLKCLEIAVLLPQADGASGLIATADELIRWVLSG